MRAGCHTIFSIGYDSLDLGRLSDNDCLYYPSAEIWTTRQCVGRWNWGLCSRNWSNGGYGICNVLETTPSGERMIAGNGYQTGGMINEGIRSEQIRALLRGVACILIQPSY